MVLHLDGVPQAIVRLRGRVSPHRRRPAPRPRSLVDEIVMMPSSADVVDVLVRDLRGAAGEEIKRRTM